MYLIAIFMTLCGLSVVTQDVGPGLALMAAPWLAAGAGALWRRGRVSGIDAGSPTRRARPANLEAIAARLRSRLDANAAMVLRAWQVCGGPGDTTMRDQLLTFCQHALDRSDMFVLADHGSTLAREFRDWLGDDLLGHVQTQVLPRAGELRAPPLADHPRLIAHARRHGWLAPTTLALVAGGTPLPAAQMRTPAPKADVHMHPAI